MRVTRKIGGFSVGVALLLAGCGGSAAVSNGSSSPAAPASLAASQSAASAPTSGAASKPSAVSSAAASRAAGAASSPGATAKSRGTYSFGMMVPLTGPAASIGGLFRRGLDMAVSEINAQGGAGGYTLAANLQDHKGTAQGGTEAMNQLVNIAKVPYVISSFSSPTLVSQPIAAQNRVVLLNVGGTDSTLLDKPWLYDNQVMAPHLMPPLAQFAWDEGKRKAAILASNDAYGDGSAKAFGAAWQKLGGQVGDQELFPVSATDFTAQLTKVKAANPDLLMVVAVGQTQGLIVKQARSLGIKAEMVGPLATADLVKAGGDAANGFIDSGIAVDPNTKDPQARKFLDNYKQKYGSYPEWDSGTPYEATYLLRDLIDEVVKAGGDPRNGDALLKALQAHPTFHNYLAGGEVKFTADHSVDRTMAIRRVENGEFKVIKLVQP